MIEFKLVFSGKLAAGASVDGVKANLKDNPNFSDQAIAHIFKPRMKPLVIKTVPSFEKANQLCFRFLKLGLILDIVETNEDTVKQTTETGSPKVATRKNPVKESPPIGSGFRTVIVERLKSSLSSIFALSTLITLSGIFLCYTYMPYPDGMLRNGFVAGLVALFLGWRSYSRSQLRA